MKVIEALNKGKPTLSFEFFPPKTDEQVQMLFSAIEKLNSSFHPDFVSVTYGAMGNTRSKTFSLTSEIKNKFKIEAVAHLTCVAATRKNILDQLDELKGKGVENILALRGDPPEGQAEFVPPADGFNYAKDLIAFIKKNRPSFCLGAAGFPEGHVKTRNIDDEIKYLKMKIEAGAEYVITQLFFDNKYYFDYVKKCRKAGIEVPIIPGVMPITNFKVIGKITKVCGATIPVKWLEKLEGNGHNDEFVLKLGVEQMIEQCQELINNNVPGLHFFLLNQHLPITQILSQLKGFRK